MPNIPRITGCFEVIAKWAALGIQLALHLKVEYHPSKRH
ncbi:hypothetical protein FBZ85_12340 [Azospirillum brasilense]|uniref:Uncharacterized protein n=1 Tax=Azospirillum baldaniorum TaxID=1064539 RepID=A0A9P1NSF2_9PROT|nr:hypothetical protein FBZ85_12340 [Azospirillum brasilense]CCD03822.1 protein of unknown function [Azospirillum baldaniorum]